MEDHRRWYAARSGKTGTGEGLCRSGFPLPRLPRRQHRHQLVDAANLHHQALVGHRRLDDAEIDDLRGVMVATFVVDGLGMAADGGYVPVDWEPFDVARRVVSVVRECVAKKLAAEPLV